MQSSLALIADLVGRHHVDEHHRIRVLSVVCLGLDQRRRHQVLLRQSRLTSQRPVDANVGIVPHDRPIPCRLISRGDLVVHTGLIAQNEEAMTKSFGNPELSPVLFAEY